MRAVAVLGVALTVSAAACGGPGPMSTVPAGDGHDPFAAARQAMVERQLRGRGIRDARVLQAMGAVPRHLFVPAEHQADAYDDRPLPIGLGQTISQPYIVAFMTEALRLSPEDKVLEIGTGSGYQAAVLGALAEEVYSVELLPELADRARAALSAAGIGHVHVRAGDGYLGWPEEAPFTKIIVTAAPEQVPPALIEQLAVNGRLVIPVGPQYGAQELRILTRTEHGIRDEQSLPVQFVPLVRPPRPGDGQP